MARSLTVIFLGVFVAGFVWSLPIAVRSAAAADLDKKGKADAKEAIGLYKEGHYEEAARVFVNLSVAHPDMLVFVRNLGACYYYLRRNDPALSNLRDYLHRKKDITADDRAEVEAWISELEHLRGQAATPPVAATALPVPVVTTPAPPASALPGALPPTPSAAPVAQPAPDVPAMPPSQPSDYGYPAASQHGTQPGYPQAQYSPQPVYPQAQYNPPSDTQYPPVLPVYGSPTATENQSASAAGLGADTSNRSAPLPSNNNAAWIVGGIGVAVLATGGIFTYLSQSAFSDTEKQYNPSKDSTGKTYADIQGVCYGLGAAGVVTAIIMMATKDHHASNFVALAPVVRPDSVGAVIHYAY